MELPLSQLGLTGVQPIRDIWQQKDLARIGGTYSTLVPRHGVAPRSHLGEAQDVALGVRD